MTLDVTTIVTGAIGAFVLGISNGVAIVLANRYTIRFLDRIEKSRRDKKN